MKAGFHILSVIEDVMFFLFRYSSCQTGFLPAIEQISLLLWPETEYLSDQNCVLYPDQYIEQSKTLGSVAAYFRLCASHFRIGTHNFVRWNIVINLSVLCLSKGFLSSLLLCACVRLQAFSQGKCTRLTMADWTWQTWSPRFEWMIFTIRLHPWSVLKTPIICVVDGCFVWIIWQRWECLLARVQVWEIAILIAWAVSRLSWLLDVSWLSFEVESFHVLYPGMALYRIEIFCSEEHRSTGIDDI